MKFVLTLFALLILNGAAIAQQDSLTKQDSTSLRGAVDSVVSQTPAEEPPVDHTISFSLSPSIGFTFQSISRDQEETQNLQWLAQLQSKFSYEGSRYQFASSLFAQYGALVTRDAPPLKSQDHIQLSAVPSITLSKNLGLRLFFEVTGETEMGKGMIDSTETRFLDPLFLYETLFLGHKTHLFAQDNSWEFEFVLGAGYAYQQTITDKFVLARNRQFVIDENNPLSHVQEQFTVESGYSAILELAYSRAIGENFTLKTSMRTVALTKDHFTDDIENCRVGSLVLGGLQWKFLSIDYTLHVLYDRNISPRRELDQTMVFGFRFDL
ncbi:MAG TPA: hypothetical protein VFO76_12015 [Candidatus Kapabacteria bacterium]|nr:hypothetical protein [Candidatus Kapabacteria bacterium]